MYRYKYPFIIKDSAQNLYKFSMNENTIIDSYFLSLL